MSTDGQGTKYRRNIAENFNRLSRVHERYRQTTDGRATAYSEREREFTYAKNLVYVVQPFSVRTRPFVRSCRRMFTAAYLTADKTRLVGSGG